MVTRTPLQRLRSLCRFCLPLLLCIPAACSLLRVPTDSLAGEAGVCAAHFQAQNEQVDARGVRDEGAAPVAGFPWLRADRFLASYAPESLDPRQRRAWIDRLSRLDAQARRIERVRLGGDDPGFDSAACRKLLNDLLAEDEDLYAALRARVQPPSDYLVSWRVLGLYPLTAPFVLAGVQRWHRDAHDTFATPLAALPVAGRLQRWSSRQPSAGSRDPGPKDMARDALGIPAPGDAMLATLFNAHAPTWEVDVVTGSDLIGRPLPVNPPRADTGDPVEYRLVSFTRWQGQVLLQLNYAIWFPARPGDDMYAGALDGVLWRVTLDSDGLPLVYDSIHNCGCYHQFFPRAGLALRDEPAPLTEPPLVPQAAPRAGPLAIRLAAGTHYIERVYPAGESGAAIPLRAAPYAELRAAGLFDTHGLVQGSERPERFLLWPMGIRSPGAMRQWGRHATAFVGRRHFDDPFLLDTLFEEVPAR